MSLTTKALILTFLIWISFLAIPYTQILHFSLIYITAITLFSMLIFYFIRYFNASYIKGINKFIDNISKFNTMNERIKVTGSDEMTDLSNHINKLLEQLQKSHEETQQYLIQFNQILKATNEQLHMEINERKTTEKVLSNKNDSIERITSFDLLTELPTRVFFNESLNKAIIHAHRRKQILAVLLINLDCFKRVNAAIGRDSADLVLKEISLRFSKTLRSEDLIARIGGDEFIVLLNDIGKPKFASTVAEKLLRSCSAPIFNDGREFTLTASIGVVVYPDDGNSLETLLTNVNTALATVKHDGGNGYQFYTKAMDVEGHEYIQLESALRNAIENGELSLHYQPKMHLKRGNINGVETLIRWEHPEFGTINPSVFIPLAEDTNLILSIGEWALTEACKANKRWQKKGYEHVAISLNLSTKQFYQADISDVITRILKETGLSPEYLELEISESTIMNDISKSMEILSKIKATGAHISIDHFGVGYTSISHLKYFPVSTIKIDQSFIKGIPNNPNDLSIINAFIMLAHNFGLTVVAEGVETAEQVEYLAAQYCDMVQGFYLSYPVSEDKMETQFKKLTDEVLI